MWLVRSVVVGRLLALGLVGRWLLVVVRRCWIVGGGGWLLCVVGLRWLCVRRPGGSYTID